MRTTDVVTSALGQIRANLLRSFFTLLGIIVSVTFLVAVIAIIQGMNAYVRENLAGAIIGSNAFQVRRTPIQIGLFDDEQIRRLAKRPKITPADAEAVKKAIPEAVAVSLQSGWPTPQADIVWHDRTMADVLVFGVTEAYQLVQDYRFTSGTPLSELDVRDRRPVIVIGADVGDKLFEGVDPVGRDVRINGDQFTVVGVIA